uniref:Piezo non-specific cation channel R-Ras-binding domain-containing protein n=1 Tax=Plectus sambesii TaxID=2011161 RepID=A0A914UL47_9BILA
MRTLAASLTRAASYLFMVAALLRPCIFGVFYAAFSIICAQGTRFGSRRKIWTFVLLFCFSVCCAQGIFLLYDWINGRVETITICEQYKSADWLSIVGIYRLKYKWAKLEFIGWGPGVFALLSSLICCLASAINRKKPRRGEASEQDDKRHTGRIIFHLFLLCMLSITDPSFINLPYFITFLIALIVISFAGRNVISLDRSVLIMRFGSWFTACHLIAIYVFQLPATSNNITSMITNMLGLVNFFEAACHELLLPTIVPDLLRTKVASVSMLLVLHVELCRCVRQGLKVKRSQRALTEEGTELQNLVIEEDPASGDQIEYGAALNPIVWHPPKFSDMAKFLQKIKQNHFLKTAAEYVYITVPVAIVSWAIMFPSIPSLIWMIMVLGTLPFAGTPRRRARILLPLALVSVILLILQYCCSLIFVTEDSLLWLRMGFGTYLVSVFNEQPGQGVDNLHWISMQSRALWAAIWMPCTLICFLEIAFLKHFLVTVRLKRITISTPRVRELPLRSEDLSKTKIFVEIAVRFSKRHFWKTVAISMTFLAVNEVAAVFLPLMIIVVVMVIFPASRSWCCLVATILLCTVWIIRFFIQFFVGQWPTDLMAWIGLQSMDDNWRIVLTISLICVQCRLLHVYQNPCQHFDDINFITADENWRKYALFVFKYFFYKFGQEVSFIWSVCLATYRQDVVGMIYLIAVFLMIVISRSQLRKQRATIWEAYGTILALIFLAEYALRLQLPPGVIQHYPWAGLREKTMSWFFLNSKLKKHTTTDVLLMCGDLVQLMLVWSQESVFRKKPSEKGGDNILPNEKTEGISTFPSHCTDYVTERPNLLSILKKIVFFCSHWITLIIILISIAFDDSFFAVIYTFGAFAFLWQGTRLYAQNSLPKFLRSWMCLLYYNIAVLFFKFIYIGIGSFFMVTPPSWMWLKLLLGLGCKSNPAEPIDQMGAGEVCTTITDVIIFTSLVCQIRILNSWQFLRVVVDYRADRVLKSSGTKSISIMKASEDRDNRARVQDHLNRLEGQLINEDERCADPESCVQASTHHQIKRSGSYHHVTEESMPQKLQASSRATLFHKYGPWWLLSEWFFNESIGHAYVAYRHEEEKKELKQTHLHELLQAQSKKRLKKLTQDYNKQEIAPGVFASSISTTSEVKAQIGREQLEEACKYWENQHIIVRIINSITTHTKMLCFVCLIATHAFRPALITLPLPLFVFLWGALSVRPSKNFFIACIIYVGFIIQLRFLVQIIDRFCDLASDQETAAKCRDAINSALSHVGLVESENTFNKLWEILLLVVLLWHRYKVFRLGLWQQYKGHNDVITRIGKWIRALRNNKEPTSHDWYAFMITCDFLFIFVLVIFYSFIGEGGSGDLLDDVRDSGVPRWLLPSLLILVCMMIFDRFIYLTRQKLIRLIYFLTIAIGLHIVFIIFLFIRRDSEYNTAIPTILYTIKCVYLLMYSWHIRHGCPSISSVDILDKKFWGVRLVLMKIYLNIPLLVEVRAGMDFWLTTTSLSFSDWRRLENYHNKVAVQNCHIRSENFFDKHFPTKRDQTTSMWSRCCCGFLLLLFCLTLIFSPFMFAYLKFYGTRVPPKKIVLTVRLQGYPFLYYVEAQHANVLHLSEEERDELMEKFEAYPTARQRQTATYFLNEYDENQDIYRVLFPIDSLTEWPLSQPGLTRLLLDLNNTAAGYKFEVEIKFELYRSLKHNSVPHVWSNTIELTDSERTAFFSMIRDRSIADPVPLQFGLPPYVIAPNEGQLREARPLTALLTPSERDMTFKLKLNSGSSRASTYWQMTNKVQSLDYMLESPRAGNDSMVQLIVFVEKVFPASARKVLEWLGIGRIGMLGLMAFVLLVVGQKVFRPCFDTKISNAALENLPNVDNILYLIRDIYLAREKKKWYLEKRLFQKLVFLFRSSETLIAWSRYTIKAKEQ